MPEPDENRYEIAVVGAGPCGLGVGIAARRAGVSCILFDKGSVASSIGGYPTFMTFFSTAERLEIGGVPFVVAGEKPTRREALRYYQRLATEYDLAVHQYEEVIGVERGSGGFVLQTVAHSGRRGRYVAANVVIATGYFDHPNLLNVPGEDLPKVLTSYREGHSFYRQRCVVVGGGNSAVDAALELYRWGAHVTLVHFEPALDRGVKPWVLPDITNRLAAGDIKDRFGTRIAEIRPESVILRGVAGGGEQEIGNDWVLRMTGYTPDPKLLRGLGVAFDPGTGVPAHDAAGMETNVEGVFIAGVLAAGNDANKVFIENGREHGDRIVAVVTARRGGRRVRGPGARAEPSRSR